MSRRLLLFVALSMAMAAPGRAGEIEPAPRPLAQASTKAALSDTKLPDEIMTGVYTELESFSKGWAGHVIDVGSTASKEDLRAVVDGSIREKLQQRGISLSQQEAIIDALVLRAKADVEDFARMAEAQGEVKRALEDSGTEEPALSAIFDQVKDFAAGAHARVIVPGAPGADRQPAAGLVENEVGPILDEHEFPDKHRAALLKALVKWIEARASLVTEDPARRE